MESVLVTFVADIPLATLGPKSLATLSVETAIGAGVFPVLSLLVSVASAKLAMQMHAIAVKRYFFIVLLFDFDSIPYLVVEKYAQKKRGTFGVFSTRGVWRDPD